MKPLSVLVGAVLGIAVFWFAAPRVIAWIWEHQ